MSATFSAKTISSRVAGAGEPAERQPEAGVEEARGLIVGYLSVVAGQLDQRGIAVQRLSVSALFAPRLVGTMHLIPHAAGRHGWNVSRVDWLEITGWCATLVSAPTTGDIAAPPVDAVGTAGSSPPGATASAVRYLPNRLVPAPYVVAHFIAALAADEKTIWATSVAHPPLGIDRRWLARQLSRFAVPDPW
jgi:hypothetical protein